MPTTKRHSPNYQSDQELTDFIALLKKHRIQPKKRLGQTFLFKRFISEEIVRLANITDHDVVIEIGPGLGALTRPLAEKGAQIIGLEYDRILAATLQKAVREPTVEIIRADALNFDYHNVFNKHTTKLKIIGNLPYYLTSPLIFKLLKLRPIIEGILVMIQKEVADRLTAQPGTRDYGTISIFAQLYCEVKKQLTVTKDNFYPRPKVDSEMVAFTVREKPLVAINDALFFEKLVRASFLRRRKTLLNALKATDYFNRGKDRTLEVLTALDIDPQRRPETLSISEFSKLATHIMSD
jgi:16S rRNA (adenine1518-N6/adenine1519-N6)-dimethyltransferase